MDNSNKILIHHGIEGQEWGKRNGPPYPLDPSKDYSAKEKKYADKLQKSANKSMNKGSRDSSYRNAHTIPKGTTIYRTTDSSIDDSEQKYVSYLEADRNHYKGGWIRQHGKTGEAYEHEYVLVEDVKVPSRQELSSVINDVMRNNPKLIRGTVEKWVDIAIPPNSLTRWEYFQNEEGGIDKGVKKFVDESLKNWGNKTPDELYYYTAQTLGLNKPVKDKVINELSKRGYNAMVDEASVGGQNGWRREGADPLILFNNDMLKSVSTTKISDAEEKKARIADLDWNTKVNRDTKGQWNDHSFAIGI